MPTFHRWMMVAIAGLLGSLSLMLPASAGPSANYFGYITSYGTADSLAWEASHYNLVNCGDTDSLIAHKTANPALPQYRYDLLRYITPSDVDKLNFLQDYAEARGGVLDDMFVHYTEDTGLVMRTSSNTGLTHDQFLRVWLNNGSVYAAKGGYTASQAAFAFGAGNDMLYLGYTNPFNEVNIPVNTASGGSFAAVWEYWNGSAWATLSVTDGTAKLTTTGKVSFAPPSNWARTTVNSVRCYFVRLRVTAAGTSPNIGGGTGIRPAPYITLGSLVQTGWYNVIIPGWDAAADADGDGYLNATEWVNRATGKNARFRYQARLPGREYIWAWSWMVNMGGSLFQDAMKAWLVSACTTRYSGFAYDGIMFDEFLPGFNYWLYANRTPVSANPTSGGTTAEYSKPGTPNWTTANNGYDADTITALGAIKTALNAAGKSLGINLGRTYWPNAEAKVNFVNRELAYYSQSNTAVFTNISDNANLAAIMKRDHANGLQSLVQHQKGLRNYLGTSAEVLARDKYLGLAMFYLMQNPATDYFQSWYGTYYTSAKSQDEYVPAVAANIGSPNGLTPSGCTAVVGPDSNMFILATGTCLATGKTYKVLGREYTKAIVLVKPKPDYASNNATTFGDTSATTHSLPATTDNPGGRYFLVRPDGTVETTLRSAITLRNGEAAILLKETPGSGPALETVLSYSPASVPPGQVITCTLVVRNTGSTAIANAEGNYTPRLQENYVANSAKLNGVTVTPDPFAGGTISVPIGALAAGQSVTITFQLTID